MKGTVLITGVTGFIGSHLALRLANEGYEVSGVTKPSVSRNTRNMQEFLKDVTVFTCDISDFHAINNLIRSLDVDTVVHLAALSPVRDSFEKPFSYEQSNVVGTMNIAHSILGMPDFEKRRLVYASTAEVYGNQKITPITEDLALNPTSPYAVTKASTDMYLRMLTHVYGMNTAIMRCTNTYGRKFDASFFVEYLITSMLNGNKIYIGAPDSVRAYMYVDDHVNAYVKAIEKRDIKGEAFNFCVERGLSNKEVALKIADLMGYDKKKIEFGKYPPNYPIRPIESDQSAIVLDSTKAKKMLGWSPAVSLDEGLKRTIAYWKARLKAA